MVAAATVLAAGSAGAATVVIDHFQVPTPGQTVTRTTIGTSSSLYNGGGVDLLGGSRLMTLTLTAEEGTGARASANGSVLGKLVYENGSGGDSLLSLAYDGNGAGLGQNWASLLELTFIVDQADLNATVFIELFSDSNFAGPSYATETTAIPPIGVVDTAYFVPFTSFETFGGFDFSDVDSMRVTFQGPAGYDLAMHEISVSNVFSNVPEPGTFASAALAAIAVGFGVTRRRRAPAASRA